MSASSRSPAHRPALVVAAAATLACGGAPPPIAAPPGFASDPAPLLVAAAEAEQTRGPAEALRANLDLVDRARAATTPEALATLLGALDALVGRSLPVLQPLGAPDALAYRTPDATHAVLARLGAAWERAAGGPFARGLIARAAYELAADRGDANGAATWRSRSGCVQRATAVGPIGWPPLLALAHPTPLEDPAGALAPTYAGVGPLGPRAVPVGVEADECDLPVDAQSSLDGLRAIVVDVEVPRPQRIGIGLVSASAAVVVVGGRPAIARAYDLGGDPVLRLGTADVPAGSVRVVVRVAKKGEGGSIELGLWGDDGSPLRARAPAPGQAATAAASRAGDVPLALQRADDAGRMLSAAALLAAADARTAEHLLEDPPLSEKSHPFAHVLYARALLMAEDLPPHRQAERARAAFARTLEAWPTAWEAIVGSAQLQGRRRDDAEGPFEALREVDRLRAGKPALDPMVRAYEAAIAEHAGMKDVALRAFGDVRAALGDSPMVVRLGAALVDRTGAEQETFVCETAGLDRNTTACAEARRSRGNHAGALAELGRLRALRGSAATLRETELRLRIAIGDAAGALRVHDAMLPAERSLGTLGLLLRGKPADLRARVLAEAPWARDAPGSIAAVLRAAGDDPAAGLDERGARLVAEDRAAAAMPGAATAVLEHTERYDLDERGLLRVEMYDLRRASGTTDVELAGQSGGASVEGRQAFTVLRRKVHKKDGRTLEPDRAAFAAQGHSDLAQLEPGDHVEMAFVGWALPDASGHLVVDTSDLLPERTSVRSATIEVAHPASLRLALWSHPLLGKAAVRTEGGRTVLTWTVRDRPPRRLEEGVPKMDREVAVSFGTLGWDDVARSIAENVAAHEDRDPTVTRWAREAGGEAGPAAPDARAVVDRLVGAVGKKVKVASGGDLSDAAARATGGAQTGTARTVLELGEGSRSWLLYRALHTLGIPAEIVVAETEPFSAHAAFPPHAGRFDHPLVVAKVPGSDLWLDADVEGPPLPAGRVSPELRGRVAMTAAGAVVPVPGGAGDEERDEVDLRLRLGDGGTATGTFTILLRGRPAQSLADAFERVVGTDRRNLLRNVVLGWIPSANVDDVTLSSSEGSWQVAIRAEVTVPGYAQREGKTLVLPGLEPVHRVFPAASVGTLGATLAAQGARESALAIETAFQWHVHRRVELPAGLRLVGTLPAVDVKDARLEASRRGAFQTTGGAPAAVDEHFALSLPTGTVDPERYADFAAKARRVDDMFLAATRVGR